MVLLAPGQASPPVDWTCAWRTDAGRQRYLEMVNRMCTQRSAPTLHNWSRELEDSLQKSLMGMQFAAREDVDATVRGGARDMATMIQSAQYYQQRNMAYAHGAPAANLTPLPQRDRPEFKDVELPVYTNHFYKRYREEMRRSA